MLEWVRPRCLRSIAQGLGGSYQRIEGTIDLMPADLIYYTYLDRNAKPCVDPGPLLAMVNSFRLSFLTKSTVPVRRCILYCYGSMAERSVSAFNTEYQLPYVQVFADRNRVEREETFELPAAARDRFLMEIGMDSPKTTYCSIS